jgi:hypothetical protein
MPLTGFEPAISTNKLPQECFYFFFFSFEILHLMLPEAPQFYALFYYPRIRIKFSLNMPEFHVSIQGPFKCRKSTTLDPQLYFPSEGSRTKELFALKNLTASAGFEPANFGSKGQHATSRQPKPLATVFRPRCHWSRRGAFYNNQIIGVV